MTVLVIVLSFIVHLGANRHIFCGLLRIETKYKPWKAVFEDMMHHTKNEDLLMLASIMVKRPKILRSKRKWLLYGTTWHLL